MIQTEIVRHAIQALTTLDVGKLRNEVPHEKLERLFLASANATVHCVIAKRYC